MHLENGETGKREREGEKKKKTGKKGKRERWGKGKKASKKSSVLYFSSLIERAATRLTEQTD